LKKKRIQILPPKKEEAPKPLDTTSQPSAEKQIPALLKEELDKILSDNAEEFLEQNKQKDGE
jgi:hypothetical protein